MSLNVQPNSVSHDTHYCVYFSSGEKQNVSSEVEGLMAEAKELVSATHLLSNSTAMVCVIGIDNIYI